VAVVSKHNLQLSAVLVEVFWVLTPFSVVVGYQLLRSPCYLHLRVALTHETILPQTRRPRFEISPPWKPQISLRALDTGTLTHTWHCYRRGLFSEVISGYVDPNR